MQQSFPFNLLILTAARLSSENPLPKSQFRRQKISVGEIIRCCVVQLESRKVMLVSWSVKSSSGAKPLDCMRQGSVVLAQLQGHKFYPRTQVKVLQQCHISGEPIDHNKTLHDRIS
jgi:hypothetical protein